MTLKPGKTCKFKAKCPYTKECFGLRMDRSTYFRCNLVDEDGGFEQTENHNGSVINTRMVV